jgi:hypothetical protein
VLLWIYVAKIQMPMLQMIEVFKEVIQMKYPSLVNCWGALDGVKLEFKNHLSDRAFFTMAGCMTIT